MGTNQDYKNRALQNLTGNWGSAAIVTLVFFLLYSGISNMISTFLGTTEGFVFNIVWVLCLMPLSWGYVIEFLDLTRGQQLSCGKLFDGFKNGQWGRIFTTSLLVVIYTTLWTLLFIIPGIIKSFSYAMTSFVLKDHPEMSNNAAIEESMRLMQGNKMRLFWLLLSFIGWGILAVLTLGIGFLLLYPYMETTLAHFYEDLKAERGE